ncbi:MAG: acyltransferase [Bacteroidota bacterium]|nr:acyltransferase [Bacteroidota bacterium]
MQATLQRVTTPVSPVKTKTDFYLPNLNSLRAIAAIMVVISHIEQRSRAVWGGRLQLHLVGRVGVVVFFTLSGFLITYLLLKEKELTQHIAFKKFYLRRALRIWPLYFFLLLFIYVIVQSVFPQLSALTLRQTRVSSICLNLLFLTNITFILKLTPFIITPVWSIGIEEQFYLFWPWIVKTTKGTAMKLIAVVIFLMPVFRFAANLGGKMLHSETLRIISKIIATTKFDLMAVGGIIAYLGYYKRITISKKTIKATMLQSAAIQWISIAGFFLCLSLVILQVNPEFQLYPISIFTGIIIYNLALNKQSVIRLETGAGNYLGKISYGLYLLHMPIIFLAYHFLGGFFKSLPVVTERLVSYLVVIGGTILTAAISYRFLESPFLKMKFKFSYLK